MRNQAAIGWIRRESVKTLSGTAAHVQQHGNTLAASDVTVRRGFDARRADNKPMLQKMTNVLMRTVFRATRMAPDCRVVKSLEVSFPEDIEAGPANR